MAARFPRLAHGWVLAAAEAVPPALVRDFVRPAVRAVPSAMARRVGVCQVSLAAGLDSPDVASRWTAGRRGVEIRVAIAGREDHDIAMEILLCLGQVLWERLDSSRRKAYWLLLEREISGGTDGEIDEEAVAEKKALLAGRSGAASRHRLERYGSASFAGTAAEYVHALWHDVTVRSDPDCLPASRLRRRLEMLARWFPPDRGYKLFPRRRA